MKLCQTAEIRYGRVAQGHFWSKSMSLDRIPEDNLVFICKRLLSVSKKFELFQSWFWCLNFNFHHIFLNVNFNTDILNFRMTTQKYACI